MKRNALSILNGFKNVQNSTFNEILKGVIDPSKVNNEKFDIFSKWQVKKYLDNILENNIGLAKEIQKGVVEETKSELGKLIPVNIKKGSKIEKFYIAKKGDCTELLKAVEPVNNQEDYFENDDEFDEEEILNYIRDNQPDDDKLVNEFGDGIIDFINKLHEDGKIDVSDDGFYLLKESSDEEGDEGNEDDDVNNEGGDEGNEGNQEGDDEGSEGGDDNGLQGEENQEGENQEGDEGNNDNGEEGDGENNEGGDDNNGEGEEGDGNISSEGMGLNGEELNLDGEGSQGEQEGGENNNEGDSSQEGDGDNNLEGDNNDDVNNEGGDEGAINNDLQENNNNGDDSGLQEEGGEGTVDNNIDEGGDGEGDNNFSGDLNNDDDDDKKYTPEELENFAKKTATATLIKFYKNSEDEDLKDVVAIELKTRGIDIASESDEKNGDNDLPNNKAELDELEDWIKNYLGSYDKEDLVKFVADLANQSPAKRKELKEAYRKYYSSSNNGNQALKVDEKDFKDFLENHYFNNFTDGDLQSMAFLLVSKNPKEYKKFKSMYEEERNPLI